MVFYPQGFGSAGSSGSITVADSHVFADTTARDAYFASHASELINDLYIYITAGTLLQQYDLGTTSWIDRTPVVRGPSGTDGESVNVYIQPTEPSNPAQGDIWVDTDDVIIDTDSNMIANSDAKIPSQKAVKTYVDQRILYNPIGIEWDTSSSSPTLTRIDRYSNVINIATGSVTNVFDSHPIHGNIKRCILTADGIATYGSDAKGTGLTLTNDYVMVKISRVYVKFESSGTKRRWWISATPEPGFSIHPAFYQRGHALAPLAQLYVGAYNAGADGGTTTANGVTNTIAASNWTGLKLTSKSGVKSLTTGTVAQMETAGNLIGTGWGLMNFWTWNLLQLLFYVEYASFDSQSKLGQGRTNGSNTAASVNGTYLDQVGEGAGVDIQSLLSANGSYGDTVGSYRPAVWRGIENIWGNLYQFCPGYNPTDTEHHILKRDGTGTISGDLASGSYETVTSPSPLNGVDNISGTDAGAYCHGYVQELAFDTTGILNLTFTPNVLTGSSSTYLCDRYYSHSAGLGRNGVLMVGGNWSSGGVAGIGCRSAYDGPEAARSSLGGRAEFIG